MLAGLLLVGLRNASRVKDITNSAVGDCLTAERFCFYTRTKIEGPRRFLGLEVVSRLQKVNDVIRCKWFASSLR